MPSLRPFVSQIAAWPRLCAVALGALAACGFEPLHLWPLTLLALAGFMGLIAQAPGWKRALLLGWLFGVGHFTIGNNWIAVAFTYQANMPAWLGWIAVVALSLYLAVYPAMAALCAWQARRSRLALVLAFAGGWIVSEWLRSWVFTGYAWNPLGMAALGPFHNPGLAGAAPWLGTYGLSGVVVLLAGAWFAVFARDERDWRAALGLVVPAMAILAPWPMAPVRPSSNGLHYTLVQPDVRQEDLADETRWSGQVARIAALSGSWQAEAKRLVLWPESGMPFFLREGYPRYFYLASDYVAEPGTVRRAIGQSIGPGSLLFTGSTDLELRGEEAVGARNVITVIGEDGAIKGSYAKAHLVPYGEYLPMRPLLEPLGLSRLVPGSIDFWPGPGPQTLDLGPWGKAGMQICYEIVFSGQVADREHRPDYLFNPSNDGWFGAWGPPQHLAQARMRAIEEGLPVLRATTTGISAVIAPDGRVIKAIPSHVAGRIDGIVPQSLAPTLFARLGNLLPLIWAAVLLGLSLVAMRRRRS